MIKSLLAVAVAGTFATCASAAPLNGVNDWYTATATAPKYGAIDVRNCKTITRSVSPPDVVS